MSFSVSNTEYNLGAVHMSQAEIQRKFTWITCINKEATKLSGADRNISHYILYELRYGVRTNQINELLFAML